MKANTLWEARMLRDLTTEAAVADQIRRCQNGNSGKQKLNFLARLKEHVATDGLEPIDLTVNSQPNKN